MCEKRVGASRLCRFVAFGGVVGEAYARCGSRAISICARSAPRLACACVSARRSCSISLCRTIHRIGEPQQFRLHDSGLRRVQTRAEGGTVERVRRVDDVLVARRVILIGATPCVVRGGVRGRGCASVLAHCRRRDHRMRAHIDLVDHPRRDHGTQRCR